MELTPEREQARLIYTERITQYIAGLILPIQLENPMPYIGMDDEVIS